VGDSRAFLARRDHSTGLFVAVPLTIEHTLDKEDEVARIKSKGGKVFAYEGKKTDTKSSGSNTRRNSIRRNSIAQQAPLRIWCSVESSKATGPNRRLSLTRRGSVCNSIGLAMTRSLGDTIAHDTSGVLCEPSYLELSLNFDTDYFIVAGSDGLWDVISYDEALSVVNEEVTNIGTSWSPQQATELLVERARLKWENQSRSIDDITCCIIKL
jgi:serine/threonine protein phosphatase PrpC